MKKFNLNKKSNMNFLQKEFEDLILDLCEDAKNPIDALESFHLDLKSMEASSDGTIRFNGSYGKLFADFMTNWDIEYYDEEREFLKKLYDETEEESEKFNNEEVEKQYRYLQFKGYLATCAKYSQKTFWDLFEIL